MAPKQDPHQSASFTDMAAAGTSIPNDAGQQNTIPSVPRPDQLQENSQFNNEGVAESTKAFAADNDTDVARNTKDMGGTGEVITGTGNTIGAGQAEAKRT